MAFGSGINKTIYPDSPDRRMNLYNAVGLDEVKLQGRSVACMMHGGYLQPTPSGYQLKGAKTLGEHRKLEAQAKFYDELVVGTGTAYLVASDLVLTAAHCVCTNTGQLDQTSNQNMRIVFDYQMLGDKKCQESFDTDCVYSIKKVVAYQLSQQNGRSLDWALVKLDRPVVGREPLELDFQASLDTNDDVDMLGYPSGLPLKYTNDAQIQKVDHPDYIEVNLDAFGGNSGSPIFKNRKVVAILVRGLTDYETVTQSDGKVIRQPHHATESEIKLYGYEKCSRVSVIDPTYQMYIKASGGKAEDQYQLGLHYLQQNVLKKGFSQLQKAAYQGHLQAGAKLKELHGCQMALHDAQGPVHRQIVKGLNFEAHCTADACKASGNTIFVKKGLGSNVDIKRMIYNLQCPSCDQPISVKKIVGLLFWDCKFNLDGRAPPDKQIKYTETAKDQKYKIFTSDLNDLYYLNADTQ